MYSTTPSIESWRVFMIPRCSTKGLNGGIIHPRSPYIIHNCVSSVPLAANLGCLVRDSAVQQAQHDDDWQYCARVVAKHTCNEITPTNKKNRSWRLS